MAQYQPLTEEELTEIYGWVDGIPLSRVKKNIARDFSDGVLMAEIIHYFAPTVIELHNYNETYSVTRKTYNWNTLNQKVFKRMGFQLSSTDIENVVYARPEAIERVLKLIRVKLERFLQRVRENPSLLFGPARRSPGMPLKLNKIRSDETSEYIKPSKAHSKVYRSVDDKLTGKDRTIQQLKETLEILELKAKKLEELARLKDTKIQALQAKLVQYGLA